MDKKLMFVLAAILATSLNCCMAATYTANVGNFNIQVTSDEAVQINDKFAPSFYPDFTAYLVDLWIGNDLFEAIIQDYGTSTNVSEDALKRANQISYPMENPNAKSWVYTDIGGQKGLIANVQIPASIPQFEAVYSPDASGNQGTIIVTITAYTADEKKVRGCAKDPQDSSNYPVMLKIR